jgi:uncharacterized membrane protein
MDPDLQRKAQQRTDRIAAFRAELAQLEREEALGLTPEQRSRLDAHLDGLLAKLKQSFGVDVNETARRFSRGMRVGALLGGAAFFTAVLLFLHRIWGVLPSAAQVLLLTAMPLLLLAAADLTSRRGAALYFTALLGLAAGLAFALELSALSVTLNLAPSPHALLAWALFAILAAYAFGLRILLGAGLLLSCIYIASLGVVLAGGYWESFMDRPGLLIPAALVCYSVPTLRAHRGGPDFDFVYRANGGAVTLIALLILSFRGDPCCSGLPARTLEVLFQLVGLALSAGIVFHGLRLGKSGIVNLGAAGFVVFLYVRLHAWCWSWMPSYLFFMAIGLIAVGLLLVFRRLRARMLERAAP